MEFQLLLFRQGWGIGEQNEYIPGKADLPVYPEPIGQDHMGIHREKQKDALLRYPVGLRIYAGHGILPGIFHRGKKAAPGGI